MIYPGCLKSGRAVDRLDLPGCFLEHILVIVLYALGDGFTFGRVDDTPRG
jgi:hypothetical protein